MWSYADVGRTGLGNMLFSWARAEVFSAVYGARMLAVRWTQPKIGPLLRGETDLRYYTNLFERGGRLGGVGRAWVLARKERVDGRPLLERAASRDEVEEACRGRVVSFAGYKGWFGPDLPRHREIVRPRLEGMVSRTVREKLERFSLPLEIVVHVRRGDFPTLGLGEEFGDRRNIGESEGYYVRVIESLRGHLGASTPVTVFTNARAGELSEIPRMAGVRVAPSGEPAVLDLLLMSRARWFVPSSASSFSWWAHYLGGMPAVFHRPWRPELVPGKPELVIEAGPGGEVSGEAFERARAAAGR